MRGRTLLRTCLVAPDGIDTTTLGLGSPAHLCTRIREAMEVVPAHRLPLTPEGGMWVLPRNAAFAKLRVLTRATHSVTSVIGQAGGFPQIKRMRVGKARNGSRHSLAPRESTSGMQHASPALRSGAAVEYRTGSGS